MSRILLLLSALLTFTFYAPVATAAPATANTQEQVSILTVMVSDLIETDGVNGRVIVGLPNGNLFDVVLGNCNATWKKGDLFYVIGIKDVGVFMTTVADMDYAMKFSRNNFMTASDKVIEAGLMCTVSKFEAVK